MATIGQQIATPEAGWQRIDSADSKIVKKGTPTTTDANCVGGSFVSINGTGKYIVFKFYGTQLRIIDYFNIVGSGKIYIDGVSYTVSKTATGVYKALLFEVLNLSLDNHLVLMEWGSGSFGMDAIDIDSTGYLVTCVMGTQLSSPEAGWQRIDNTDTNISYIGAWSDSSNASYYGGTAKYSTVATTNYLRFNFKGDAFRLIIYEYMGGSGASDKIAVYIDGVCKGSFTAYGSYIFGMCAFEAVALQNKEHSVELRNESPYAASLSAGMYFDAIDIKTPATLYPYGTPRYYNNNPSVIKTSLADMQIGDFIPCRYKATTSGAIGTFSEFGTCTATEIPVASSATPDGLFYFVKVAKGMLIADRVIQHSIAWDTLNTAKFAEGKTQDATLAFVDGGGTTGINYDATKGASSPSIEVFNNEVYVAWYEPNASSVNQIRIKKWNGTSWSWVDGGGANGINYDVTKGGNSSRIIVFNNELYAIWQETNGSANQLRVKKYNGTSWVSVDGNGANGLNYDATRGASFPYLEVFNNELYATWYETNGSVNQIRVKKYNGSTWTFVDGNGVNGLNYDSTRNAVNPKMAVFNNELYIAWHETNGTNYQVRAKKYNGSSWVCVDDNIGLNYDATKGATNPRFSVFNNELYATWQETNGTANQIRVKKYNGSTWTFVDGNGVNGLNYDSTKGAVSQCIGMLNNELYVVWQETNASSVNQIRIKKWNGSTWTFADGGGTTGINYDATKSGNNSELVGFGSDLYITWYESNSTTYQIRVKKYSFINGLIRSLSGGVTYADMNGNSNGTTDASKGGFPSSNEWDRYIAKSNLGGKITAGDDNIWHWSTQPAFGTWVKETPFSGVGANTTRILRGTSSLYKLTWTSSSTATTNVGFRPVLEYLETDAKATTLFN